MTRVRPCTIAWAAMSISIPPIDETFKASPNSSVKQRRALIKSHNFQGQEKAFQSQGIFFSCHAFHKTVLKLGNGNRGNINVTKDKLLEALAHFRRFVFNHVDADFMSRRTFIKAPPDVWGGLRSSIKSGEKLFG